MFLSARRTSRLDEPTPNAEHHQVRGSDVLECPIEHRSHRLGYRVVLGEDARYARVAAARALPIAIDQVVVLGVLHEIEPIEPPGAVRRLERHVRLDQALALDPLGVRFRLVQDVEHRVVVVHRHPDAVADAAVTGDVRVKGKRNCAIRQYSLPSSAGR